MPGHYERQECPHPRVRLQDERARAGRVHHDLPQRRRRGRGHPRVLLPRHQVRVNIDIVRANIELFRDKFNLKLFVDTDADTRLARRVLRDISERGRDLEHVLHQYTTLVKVRSTS